MTNVLALLAVIAFHLLIAPGLEDWRGLSLAFFLALVVIGTAWIVSEGRAQRDFSLLQNGYATRATVTLCDLKNLRYDGFTHLMYEYTAQNGKRIRGHNSVSTHDVERYGDFGSGATFTVLLPEGDPYSPVPYFRITEATIPGATPARVSLP